MPKTNSAIVFARMRADVQRLLTVVHVHELRAKFDELLRVYDMLEERVRTQPLRAIDSKQPRPPRLSKAQRVQEHKTRGQAIMAAHDAGREARRNNETIEDNPHDLNSDHVLYKTWSQGWNLEDDNIARAAGANSGE